MDLLKLPPSLVSLFQAGWIEVTGDGLGGRISSLVLGIGITFLHPLFFFGSDDLFQVFSLEHIPALQLVWICSRAFRLVWDLLLLIASYFRRNACPVCRHWRFLTGFVHTIAIFGCLIEHFIFIRERRWLRLFRVLKSGFERRLVGKILRALVRAGWADATAVWEEVGLPKESRAHRRHRDVRGRWNRNWIIVVGSHHCNILNHIWSVTWLPHELILTTLIVKVPYRI